MRVVIWHGYLLGGTGSNVYTRSLARAWRRQGHDVTVICQEPDPGAHDLLGARVTRPDIGRRLPVFVLDDYDDVEARLIGDMTRTELDAVVAANAKALRAALPADLVLVNHVLLGAAVGATAQVPFAVKVHGSELEFAIRGNPSLTSWARDVLDTAHTVIVGSEHIRRTLLEVIGPGRYVRRVAVIPPGVDIDEFRPEPTSDALATLLAECRRDPPNPGSARERLPDEGNAARLVAFLQGDAPTIVYVGKLSREKGVHLFIDAVRQLGLRGVAVGFGPERANLERQAGGAVLFTGALEHRHLAHLWPLADVSVTPSIFPEAFGMVAAEAAACGAPPLVACHSGLAEIARGVEAEYPSAYAHLVSFAPGDIDDLIAKLAELTALPADERRALGIAARRAAVRRWSWEGVARAIADVAMEEARGTKAE
jgi:glycosyltransferase involved in cell wall biosynthesis